jgi:hypothetical protein
MIHTEVDPHRRLATHRGSGELLALELLSASQDLSTHPQFESDFAIVWDLRQCRIAITIDEIINLDPQIVELVNQSRPSGKTAWVASTALGEGIIKLLYQQHDWAAQWRTFSTFDAAVAWCVRDP